MIVAIMQPTYLPWLGYFDLMDQVDIFVYLDNVQFAKRSWQQRNKVKTPHGLEWITVPVAVAGRYHQTIADVEFSNMEFAGMHLDILRKYYSGAPFFQPYYDRLSEEIYRLIATDRLADLNCGLITQFCREIGIKTPVVRASELQVNGRKSDLLARLCQAVDGDTYISALGSSCYLIDELQEFISRGLEIRFHHYEHPAYRQEYPPFMPYASVVDLLFNEGAKSLEIIRSGRRFGYSTEEVKELTGYVGLEDHLEHNE